MIRTLTILLALGKIAGGQTTCEAPGQTLSQPTSRLRAYNVAAAPPKTVNRALEIAGRIFATADVTTGWEQGDTDAAEAHYTDMTAAGPGQLLPADDRNYPAIKIMRGAPRNAFPGALGYALPFARVGPHAIIFYDRIENVSRPDVISVTRLLGHAIAHEVGHALLETSGHSLGGLMTSFWAKADFRRADFGLLELTPAEKRILGSIRLVGWPVAKALIATGESSRPVMLRTGATEGNCLSSPRTASSSRPRSALPTLIGPIVNTLKPPLHSTSRLLEEI